MKFRVNQTVRCVTFARTNVFGYILQLNNGLESSRNASALVCLPNFHADGADLITTLRLDELEPVKAVRS